MAILDKCCPNSDNPGSALARQLLILGLSIGISLCFLLAAGIKYGSDGGWLAMLNLVFVVISPAAVILSETFGATSSFDGYNESKAAWQNMGSCTFGIVLVSLFGLPSVLYHNKAIGQAPYGLWMASTVITFLSSVWYWIARARARAAAL